MSSPFFPMTTPGRALWIVMRAFFAGRSITTRLTAACESFFLRKSRTLMSSLSMPGKFLVLAYHLELQLRNTERRKPMGLIFWPIRSPNDLALIAYDHKNVAARLHDARSPPLGTGPEATQERGALDADMRDFELVYVRPVIVLSVGNR